MKKIKKIIVLGAGGNSRDIIDCINDINSMNGLTYECMGILDDDKKIFGKTVMGIKVIGELKDISKYKESNFINGIYSVAEFFKNEEIIANTFLPDSRFETIIHPSSSISKTAKIGKGCLVLRNATITSNVVIGNHVTINPGTVISHDNRIGDFSFIASQVATGGYVKISKSCFIGASSSIKGWVKIGRYSVVGMGAIVLDNIPNNSVFIGNPAKFLRKVK